MRGGGMGGGMGGMGGGMGGMGGGMMGGGMGGMGMGFGSIYEIIQTVIEPESWQSLGLGGEGLISLHPSTQSLAIRQTEEVHAQIEDLLIQIRKMHDLQVAVEVRYITLSDRFYERMGTAFDMAFRQDNAASRITTVPDVFEGGAGESPRGSNVVIGLEAPRIFNANASIPVHQDSFSLTTPAFGGYNPMAGISTGFALLSNLETYFFIQAAQGCTRSAVMEAPKVMLQNGQAGFVNDTTQMPFVTSVTPVVADFAVSYQPIVTMLNQGQVLHVTATVSNDRQRVQLSLNPTFTTIVRVETFKFFGDDEISEEAASTGDDIATTSTDPRSSSRNTRQSSSGIVIQQPIMATFSVSTTVNAPDGGTVLLGGIKRLSEARSQAGVPMLNKLPYIQRLFANVGVGRDTQSIMIMVTPRVIIQEEEEDFIMGRMSRP
jgi:general secretion pathway protein D